MERRGNVQPAPECQNTRPPVPTSTGPETHRIRDGRTRSGARPRSFPGIAPPPARAGCRVLAAGGKTTTSAPTRARWPGHGSGRRAPAKHSPGHRPELASAIHRYAVARHASLRQCSYSPGSAYRRRSAKGKTERNPDQVSWCPLLWRAETLLLQALNPNLKTIREGIPLSAFVSSAWGGEVSTQKQPHL